MPIAHGKDVKYMFQDHDTDIKNLIPPVQNQWYTVFDAVDVRHLYCLIGQFNDETDPKDVEIKWTIDGTVYFKDTSLDNESEEYVYRDHFESSGGTAGLSLSSERVMAAYYTDKRGHAYKVEIRMTSALGTNQNFYCLCVRETLEQT